MAPIRLLIISDTHDEFPDPSTLPKVDVLLHCGDLTQIGGLSNYCKAISLIKQVQAELRLVIAGNHDISLDKQWWSDNLIEDEDDPNEPDEALTLFKGAKCHGIHYLEEGNYSFSLKSGAIFTIYASPYTPEFNGYAFPYAHSEDRFNPGSPSASHPVPENVDILMTHGPPKLSFAEFCLDSNDKGEHCGCPHLGNAVLRAKPRLHCFGHLHEGYGAGKITRTTQIDMPDYETVKQLNRVLILE